MTTYSNIEQLEAHLKKVFGEMFRSEEVVQSAKNSKKIMGRSVIAEMDSSGYDYDQTGNFKEQMSHELSDSVVMASRSKLSFGFGSLDELNDPIMGMRTRQEHFFNYGEGRFFNLTTRAEKQMPKWIIMEFGRSGDSQKADTIPRELQINYTRRDKKYLSKPSGLLSMWTSQAKKSGKSPSDYTALKFSGDSFYKKPTYIMLSGKSYEKMSGTDIGGKPTHPGIRAGRFFRKGLEKSKQQVFMEMSRGIQLYLDKH